MKKTFAYLTILISVILSVSACSSKNTPVSVTGMYYDTLISIDIYGAGKDSKIICDNCQRMCEHYEQLFNKNIDGSDIARINASGGTAVTVDHDTALLLSTALVYSKGSDGLFDITIDPVTSLWDFHEESARIPTDDEIKAALVHVDHNKLSVDTSQNTVALEKGMSIDPGGIAKGYIADRIADYLNTCSITGAIINMGGDIKVIGSKPDKSTFTIGINDPFGEGTLSTALSVSDTAVATSGIYERCIVSDGKTYHHILDPSTGYPVDTDIESVTIITNDATDADCLCTLTTLLGSEKAMELVENTSDTEAIILLKDKTEIRSSGADAYIRR